MKKILVILAALAFSTYPAFAQTEEAPEVEETEEAAEAENGEEGEDAEEAPSAEDIAAAAELISEVSENQEQVNGYCAIFKEMEAAPEDDEAKAEELGTRMDEYLNSLGEDVAGAFTVADSVDPESEDGQAIAESVEELNEKCAS